MRESQLANDRISDDRPAAGYGKPVLLALGFRPFFLVAGVFALLLIAEWVFIFAAGRDFENYYGVIGWHSHEMIFGYTPAVIAGFLLTAARNWTNQPTATGASLAALVVLWFTARLLPFFGGILSAWIIALTDLVFLPALTVALAIPLVRSGNQRNFIFLPLVGGLFLGNLLVHAELSGYAGATARTGVFLGLNLIVLLIVIMGGRVIPFFTERALPGFAAKRWPVIEWLSPGSVLAFVVADFLMPYSLAAGLIAALAGASNAARVAGWYTNRFWSVPLLWVLHLGYAWIVIGFWLRALAAPGWIAPQFTVHAFTVGGIGVLTLGMMARVSLGHTGRPLKVSRPMVAAFIFINLAALVRGVLPVAFPQRLVELVVISGALWVSAFAIFLAVYVPVLTQPRIDGRPG
jgi:uncharacterized protein involved in response to NO